MLSYMDCHSNVNQCGEQTEVDKSPPPFEKPTNHPLHPPNWGVAGTQKTVLWIWFYIKEDT